MVKGIIEVVDEDAVQIDGNFYRIGPKIKPELISKGECEYSIDDDEETVKFIRMDKPVKKQRTFGKNKPESNLNNNGQFRDPAEIIREGCLNSAVKIEIANQGEEKIDPKKVITIAKKFETYITGQVEPKAE